MADRNFEYEIDRMFADHLAFADADLFAARVQGRLERGWTFRQFLIGGLGLVGGLIGAGQVLSSGVLQRVGALADHSKELVSGRFAQAAGAYVLPGGLAVNGEILWMSAAMAVVAVGFGLTRVIRDL